MGSTDVSRRSEKTYRSSTRLPKISKIDRAELSDSDVSAFGCCHECFSLFSIEAMAMGIFLFFLFDFTLNLVLWIYFLAESPAPKAFQVTYHMSAILRLCSDFGMITTSLILFWRTDSYNCRFIRVALLLMFLNWLLFCISASILFSLEWLWFKTKLVKDPEPQSQMVKGIGHEMHSIHHKDRSDLPINDLPSTIVFIISHFSAPVAWFVGMYVWKSIFNLNYHRGDKLKDWMYTKEVKLIRQKKEEKRRTRTISMEDVDELLDHEHPLPTTHVPTIEELLLTRHAWMLYEKWYCKLMSIWSWKRIFVKTRVSTL